MSVLGCLSYFPFSTYSRVISIDSPLGISTAFIDTNTGLQWLDLSVTFNQSLNDVTNDLRNDGRYSGFRYATLGEVNTLLAGLGLQFSGIEIRNETQYQLLDNFLAMMAVPIAGNRWWDNATVRYAYGLTGTLAPSPNPDDPTEYFWASWLQSAADGFAASPVNSTFDAAWVEPQSTRFRSDQTISPVIGSWLILEVPEPSSLSLIFFGLVGLSLFGSRKAIPITCGDAFAQFLGSSAEFVGTLS